MFAFCITLRKFLLFFFIKRIWHKLNETLQSSGFHASIAFKSLIVVHVHFCLFCSQFPFIHNFIHTRYECYVAVNKLIIRYEYQSIVRESRINHANAKLNK
jgi:hypothetical protein